MLRLSLGVEWGDLVSVLHSTVSGRSLDLSRRIRWDAILRGSLKFDIAFSVPNPKGRYAFAQLLASFAAPRDARFEPRANLHKKVIHPPPAALLLPNVPRMWRTTSALHDLGLRMLTTDLTAYPERQLYRQQELDFDTKRPHTTGFSGRTVFSLARQARQCSNKLSFPHFRLSSVVRS